METDVLQTFLSYNSFNFPFWPLLDYFNKNDAPSNYSCTIGCWVVTRPLHLLCKGSASLTNKRVLKKWQIKDKNISLILQTFGLFLNIFYSKALYSTTFFVSLPSVRGNVLLSSANNPDYLIGKAFAIISRSAKSVGNLLGIKTQRDNTWWGGYNGHLAQSYKYECANT